MPLFNKPDTNLSWIDSHCHFDFSEFDLDRDEVWRRSQLAGVKHLLIPGITKAQSAALADFCSETDWFYGIGLHPCFMDEHDLEMDLDWLENNLSNSSAVAVGEIGLDYRPAFVEQVDQKTRQLDLLDAQLQIAKSHQKPIILHSVRANDDVAARIRRIGFGYGGVVHAFSGSRQQAEKFLELGFKLGLGGSFTHARAERMRRLIKELPVSSWLLETDAPDMAPAFSSAMRNTPEFIPLLAVAASRLANCSLEEFSLIQQQSILEVFPGMTLNILKIQGYN